MHQEFIRENKNSKSVVVFIHGILGTPSFFDFFIEAVPKNWGIYNILLDGHGKTVMEFAETSMDKWKNQVESLLDKLSLNYDNIMIVAHSMGTLFAIKESVRLHEKVKMLFLLDIPLKIKVKPSASVDSLRVIFKKINDKNPKSVAVRDAYGIEPSILLWNYLRWLPRYFELFKESYSTRNFVNSISCGCFAFQSKNDELVSISSCKYLKENKKIKLSILKSSGHFYFSPHDKAYLLGSFNFACNMVEKGIADKIIR